MSEYSTINILIFYKMWVWGVTGPLVKEGVSEAANNVELSYNSDL